MENHSYSSFCLNRNVSNESCYCSNLKSVNLVTSLQVFSDKAASEQQYKAAYSCLVPLHHSQACRDQGMPRLIYLCSDFVLCKINLSTDIFSSLQFLPVNHNSVKPTIKLNKSLPPAFSKSDTIYYFKLLLSRGV